VARQRRSEDALDTPRPRQRLGKKARQEYARSKAVEDLLIPPKQPLAAWLNDPSLLPKRPPIASQSTADAGPHVEAASARLKRGN